MRPLTLEWIKKAEGDLAIAGRELRVRKSPVYDAVCFHSQQCAEKYLKAILQENEREIPKIHNLIELLKLCTEIDSSLVMLQADLWTLERYSVRVRYPGVNTEKDEAKAAYQKTVNYHNLDFCLKRNYPIHWASLLWILFNTLSYRSLALFQISPTIFTTS
jgi:HEPN domain-containing protein